MASFKNLHFDIKTRSNKSKSLLYKTVTITNNKDHISYKTIKKFYDHLLDEGWEENKIYVKVMNSVHGMTIKGLDDDFFDDLDSYYRNKVRDPSKFTTNFEEVVFGIYS